MLCGDLSDSRDDDKQTSASAVGGPFGADSVEKLLG